MANAIQAARVWADTASSAARSSISVAGRPQVRLPKTSGTSRPWQARILAARARVHAERTRLRWRRPERQRVAGAVPRAGRGEAQVGQRRSGERDAAEDRHALDGAAHPSRRRPGFHYGPMLPAEAVQSRTRCRSASVAVVMRA